MRVKDAAEQKAKKSFARRLHAAGPTGESITGAAVK